MAVVDVEEDDNEDLTAMQKRKAIVVKVFEVLPAAPTSGAPTGEDKTVDASVIAELMIEHNGPHKEQYLKWVDATAAEREDGDIKFDSWLVGVFKIEEDTSEKDLKLLTAEWYTILARKRRVLLLTQTFMKMDADCSGAVDLNEFAQLAEGTDDAALVASLFTVLDSQGNSDGKVDLDEWRDGMLKFGADLSDEQFEGEITKWMLLLTRNQRALWHRLFKRGHANKFVNTMRATGCTHLVLICHGAAGGKPKRVKKLSRPPSAAVEEPPTRLPPGATPIVPPLKLGRAEVVGEAEADPGLNTTGEAQCFGAKTYFGRLPIRKSCYLTSPSLSCRQTAVHIAELEDVSAGYDRDRCGSEPHAELMMVNRLHPAGVEPQCDELVRLKGNGPLRSFLAADGGEDAFGRYAELACESLLAVVRRDVKEKGSSIETRPLSARVRPGSAARSVMRMAQHGARSLERSFQASLSSRGRAPARVMPPNSPRGPPFPPVSPRGTACPALLQSPRNGQYVAMFGERVYLSAIAHALGCAAGAPLPVLDAMLDINLDEAEGILVPLYGGRHGSNIQHLMIGHPGAIRMPPY